MVDIEFCNGCIFFTEQTLAFKNYCRKVNRPISSIPLCRTKNSFLTHKTVKIKKPDVINIHQDGSKSTIKLKNTEPELISLKELKERRKKMLRLAIEKPIKIRVMEKREWKNRRQCIFCNKWCGYYRFIIKFKLKDTDKNKEKYHSKDYYPICDSCGEDYTTKTLHNNDKRNKMRILMKENETFIYDVFKEPEPEKDEIEKRSEMIDIE